jgi:hypothetical protein
MTEYPNVHAYQAVPLLAIGFEAVFEGPRGGFGFFEDPRGVSAGSLGGARPPPPPTTFGRPSRIKVERRRKRP